MADESAVQAWLSQLETRRDIKYAQKRGFTFAQAAFLTLGVEILSMLEIGGDDEPPEVLFEDEDEKDDDEPWRKKS